MAGEAGGALQCRHGLQCGQRRLVGQRRQLVLQAVQQIGHFRRQWHRT
ncbi:hypothetical protein [Streptomyces platensis]